MWVKYKMKEKISGYIKNTVETIKGLEGISDKIESAARLMVATFKNGGKLIIFGNGGSAADSQHIAAEIVSKFRKERKALPAIALSTNTSIITAIANDYDFNEVFSKQIEALAGENDLALAISTSGNSQNVVQAACKAKEKKLKVIALTGLSGGALEKYADILINVPATLTSHIQEGHLAVYHILCHLVEEELF